MSDPALAPEPEAGHSPRNPWLYVPFLYFLQGLPYVVIMEVSALMYNGMGVSKTAFTTWTSIVGFAWTAKMFWGPLVETTLTKRKWILATQAIIFAGMILAAAYVPSRDFFTMTLIVFGGLALLSATHDIAADGFYLLALDKNRQAFFVGIRSTAFRLATIFGKGLLVWLAGRFIAITDAPFEIVKSDAGEQRIPLTAFSQFLQKIDQAFAGVVPADIPRAWMLAIGFGALVYGVFFLYNLFALPKPAADAPRDKRLAGEQPPFIEAFASFFKQRRIFWIVAFIIFYRFSEILVGKLSGTFLQDPPEKGGLAMGEANIGVITGYIGVVALLLGGILGGMVIAKWGIKRSFWPMVLAINIPNLFYIWAALAKPGFLGVAAVIGIDQFGYGFGFAAFLVYLMFVAQGTRFETASYAIATGIMALGPLLAGVVSGRLFEFLAQGDPAKGYVYYFAVVALLGIPGMITLLFIPMDKEDLRVRPQVD
jgi:PAT family beta-lactamase induction signal transducer AmpG